MLQSSWTERQDGCVAFTELEEQRLKYGQEGESGGASTWRCLVGIAWSPEKRSGWEMPSCGRWQSDQPPI